MISRISKSIKVMEKYELDVHTHTIANGHAYGTITEMIKAALKKKLKILGITEYSKLFLSNLLT